MWCMLPYEDKKFVENFVGQLINIKLKLIVLHTLLFKPISVWFNLEDEMCLMEEIKRKIRSRGRILPVD